MTETQAQIRKRLLIVTRTLAARLTEADRRTFADELATAVLTAPRETREEIVAKSRRRPFSPGP
jgi:hypothetical protein